MEMIRKLLNMVNLRWAQKTRIKKSFTVRRGTGKYPYLSVSEGFIYLHAYPNMGSFGREERDVLSESFFEGSALETEVRVRFRADVITELKNEGADDIYVNFDAPTTAPGTLTIRPGEVLTNIKVNAQNLYFRSNSFTQPFYVKGTYENLLYYQEINLEGMTISEVAATLTQMGYLTDIGTVGDQKALDESALVLLEMPAQPLDEGVQLYAFTSNLWRVIYPIHRILTRYDHDVDIAIEQLRLPSARGEWLDYWVSFFRIRRLPDETDELLLRRTFLTIASAKSNNIAIEELIGYYIGTRVSVTDYAPAVMEVGVAAEYMNDSQKVKDLIELLKGAGTHYILSYASDFTEMYPVYLQDKLGIPAQEADGHPEVILSQFIEHTYGWRSKAYIEGEEDGFTLNQHTLNGAKLDLIYLLKDEESLAMDVYLAELYHQVQESTEASNDWTLNETFPKASEASTVETVIDTREEGFRYRYQDGFMLNASALNGELLSPQRTSEGGSMTLEKDGKIIQSLTW